MSRLMILATALVIGSAAAGCTGNGGLAGTSQPVSGAASLQVENNAMLSMDMYARAHGVTQRLGTVSPGMNSSFVVPPDFLNDGPVELLAQPVGGGRIIRSGPLAVSPGGVIDFYIGTNYVDSRVTVR